MHLPQCEEEDVSNDLFLEPLTAQKLICLIVPDLSFSELSFLNSRRELLDRAARDLKAKESSEKKDKKKQQQQQQLVVGHDNDISKFFISNTEPVNGICVDSGSSPPRRTPAAIKRHNRQSSAITPSLLPVHLAQRPFVGFGELGPGSQSPSQPRKSPHVVSRHVGRQTRPDTVVDTTSNYTWSQSPTKTNKPISRAAEDRAYAKTTRKLSNKGPAEAHLDKVQAPSSALLRLADVSSFNASIDTIQPRKVRTAGIILGKACGEDNIGQPSCADSRTFNERNTDNSASIYNTLPCHTKSTSNSAEIAYNVDVATNEGKVPNNVTLVDSIEESVHRSVTSELVPEEILVEDQVLVTDPQKVDTVVNGNSNLLPLKTTDLQSGSGESLKQPSISAQSPKNDSREEDPSMTVHQHCSPKLRTSDFVGTSLTATNRDIISLNSSYNRRSRRSSSRVWDTPDPLYQQQIPTLHIQQNYPKIEDKHQFDRSQSEISCPSIRPYGTPISLEIRTPEIYSSNRHSSLQVDTDIPRQYEGDNMDRQDAHFGTELPIDEVLDENSTGWTNIETQRELDYNTLDVRDSSQYHQRVHTWDGFWQMENRGAVFAYRQYPADERTFQDYPTQSSDDNFAPQIRIEEHRFIGVPEEETLNGGFAPTHLGTSSNPTCRLLRKSPRSGERPLTSGYIQERQTEILGQVDENILAGFWRPNKLY